jgi:hypothetical protein
VTKAADGTTTAEKLPNTNKERWGQIAAVAIGGAFKGLAAGQGPGGAAKALGAGGEFGMQVPQQQRQNANQQADENNKQLTAKANNALLHQRLYTEMLNSQALGATVKKADGDILNGYNEAISSSPNAKDFGTIGGFDDLKRVATQNADFMNAHTNLQLKAVPIVDGDGKVTLHAVATDPGDDLQPVGKGAYKLKINVDPKTGEPSLATEPVTTGKKGQLSLANQALAEQFVRLNNSYTDAQTRKQKAAEAGVPKTSAQARSMASAATDPKEAARLMGLHDSLLADEMKLKEAGRTSISTGAGIPASTQVSDLIKPGAIFAPGTVNGTTAKKLASGDTLLADLPKRFGKGQPSPQDWIGGAQAYSQQLYGMDYSPTMIDQEKKQFDNAKQQGILAGIDKMIGVEGQPGYLDQVVDLGRATGLGPDAPLNQVELAIKGKFGDDAAKNFNTALGEVQRSLPTLIGNPMVGGGDSDLKFKAAQDMFGQNPTLSNIQSTAGVLKMMLHGSLDSYTRNNRFLQRRYGIQQSRAGVTPPNANANAPAPLANRLNDALTGK